MPLKNDNRPPNQMRREGARRGGAAEILDGLDDSLDASHMRMKYALAVQTRRIELSAKGGGLTTSEIDMLQQLSNAWRVLVTHEPAPDFSKMSPEQLEAAMAAVKGRLAK